MIRLLIKAIFLFPEALWLWFITDFPGKIGFMLRFQYWKKRLGFLGNHTRIDSGVYFQNPKYIWICENSWIDRGVIILAGIDLSNREKIIIPNRFYTGNPGQVLIGKNVHVGPGCIISGIHAGIQISDDCGLAAGCKLYSYSNHYRSSQRPYDSLVTFGPMGLSEYQCLVVGPISIGRNTGLALNVVVLPGTAIPEKCFVEINSVVHSGRYTENSILSGSPARKTKERFKMSSNESY